MAYIRGFTVILLLYHRAFSSSLFCFPHLSKLYGLYVYRVKKMPHIFSHRTATYKHHPKLSGQNHTADCIRSYISSHVTNPVLLEYSSHRAKRVSSILKYVLPVIGNVLIWNLKFRWKIKPHLSTSAFSSHVLIPVLRLYVQTSAFLYALMAWIASLLEWYWLQGCLYTSDTFVLQQLLCDILVFYSYIIDILFVFSAL